MRRSVASKILKITTALCILASALLWALSAAQLHRPDAAVARSESEATERLPTDSQAIIKRRTPAWENIRLRRPLVDPPPAAVAAAPPQPLRLTLVGTVLEGTNSQALLKTEDGRVLCKRVGEIESGTEVLAINRGSVTVRHGGREVEMRLPEAR